MSERTQAWCRSIVIGSNSNFASHSHTTPALPCSRYFVEVVKTHSNKYEPPRLGSSPADVELGGAPKTVHKPSAVLDSGAAVAEAKGMKEEADPAKDETGVIHV